MIVFGPVTSRRLGKSLGINHIPPKYCSYSCIYCQVGNTMHKTGERQQFYDSDEVYEVVSNKIEQLDKLNEKVDFITMVPDGEPALDKNLGKLIERLKKIGPPVAVISNGSLIFNEQVRENLSKADWVSLKIDAVRENLWKKINRPYGKLKFKDILKGMEVFSGSYQGILVTETMLVRDVNDSTKTITEISEFVKKLYPRHAYLLIPTRPPSESWVLPPDEEKVTEAYYIFKKHFPSLTLLIDFPEDNIPVVNHLEEEILAISSVHPVRKEDLSHMLKQTEEDENLIERLIKENKVKETKYQGNTFYVRKFSEH